MNMKVYWTKVFVRVCFYVYDVFRLKTLCIALITYCWKLCSCDILIYEGSHCAAYANHFMIGMHLLRILFIWISIYKLRFRNSNTSSMNFKSCIFYKCMQLLSSKRQTGNFSVFDTLICKIGRFRDTSFIVPYFLFWHFCLHERWWYIRNGIDDFEHKQFLLKYYTLITKNTDLDDNCSRQRRASVEVSVRRRLNTST